MTYQRAHNQIVRRTTAVAIAVTASIAVATALGPVSMAQADTVVPLSNTGATGRYSYSCGNELAEWDPTASYTPGRYSPSAIYCTGQANIQGMVFGAPATLAEPLTLISTGISPDQPVYSRAKMQDGKQIVGGKDAATAHTYFGVLKGKPDGSSLPPIIPQDKPITEKYEVTGNAGVLSGQKLGFTWNPDSNPGCADVTEYLVCMPGHNLKLSDRTHLGSNSESSGFGDWPTTIQIVNLTQAKMVREAGDSARNFLLEPRADQNKETVPAADDAGLTPGVMSVSGYRSNVGDSRYNASYQLQGGDSGDGQDQGGDYNGAQITIDPVMAHGDDIIPLAPQPTPAPGQPTPTASPVDISDWCKVSAPSDVPLTCTATVSGGLQKFVTFYVLPYER